MKFNYKKEFAEISFDENEIKIIQEKGKLVMNYENMKHFHNHLSHMITEAHRLHILKNAPEVKNQLTFPETEVKTK